MSSGLFAFVSQLAGVKDWLRNIWETVSSIPNMIFTALEFSIAALLYGVQMGFFWIIDMVQAVFRKLAGLDVYWYKESNGSATQQTGDIVESFIRSDTVWNVFLAVLIASIILLFVTTFIAILKTEFNEKDNAKGPVIKNAIKAIAYFAVVPVVCVFGITLANIFLRSFDAATAYKGATSISGQVFAAASFNASRVRNSFLTEDEDLTDVKKRLMGISDSGMPRITESSSKAQIADALDYAFVHDLTTREDVAYDFTDKGDYMAGYTYLIVKYPYDYHNTGFNKYNLALVYYYYDLLQYNYLIGYFASYTIIMLLLNLMIGVIQRIFDLTILFIISPAFVATMPLDNGDKYGKWKSKFISKTLGLYGPVVGINLAFTILTLVQRIYVFDPAGGGLNGLFNALMQCVFVITAVLCVKDFGKLVNELVGGDDITNNKAAEVSSTLQKGAAVGAKLGGAGLKVGAAALRGTARGVKALGQHERERHRLAQEKKNINRQADAAEAQLDSEEQAILAEDRDHEIAKRMSYSDRIKLQREFEDTLTDDQKDAYKSDPSKWDADATKYITTHGAGLSAAAKYDTDRMDRLDKVQRHREVAKSARERLLAQNQQAWHSNNSALRERAGEITAEANKNLIKAGQDVYGAAKLGYNNSELYGKLKTWHDMKGAANLEKSVVGAGDMLLGKGINPQTGARDYDRIKEGLNDIRGRISDSATSAKNKEASDTAKNNQDIANKVAAAIIAAMNQRGGGGAGGGTP